MADTLEEILAELSVKRAEEETSTDETVSNETETANETDERRAKVAAFHLNMDIDDEFGEYEELPVPEIQEEAAANTLNEEPIHLTEEEEATTEEEASNEEDASPVPETAAEETPEEIVPEKKRKKKRARMGEKERALWGCAGGMFYILVVIGISLVLASVIIIAALDLTGLGKSSKNVRVVVEEGATPESISVMLKENKLINHPFFFKLYANITGKDDAFKSGVYTFSANMGYGNIMDMLRVGVPRKVVTITIPEGYTIDEIAALMEENSVCTKNDFYDAVLNGNYDDYSFVASIPEATGKYAGRGYALEGYLYPDTYEFYTGSTGETVVRKFLANFDNRIDTTMRTKIEMLSEELGMNLSLNDVVIIASIVEAEAGSDEWSKVAHVLLNRLKNATYFPSLQCDSTTDYYNKLNLSVEGLKADANAYNTYTRQGLVVGAISNPGMKAIQAVLEPATLQEIKQYMAYRASSDVEGRQFAPLQYRNDAWNAKGDYYFFATNMETGVTYYTTNATDHGIICSHYGI